MKNKLNIIFDFDSTLVKIEGIDELARMNNKIKEVSMLTNQAMNGEVSFEKIFRKRLEIIKPSTKNLEELNILYSKNLLPGLPKAIDKFRKIGNIFIVSGGYKTSMIRSASFLKIPKSNIFANELLFDDDGNYLDFDKNSPLWRNYGKKIAINLIKEKNPLPTILIGDGYSDLECLDIVDLFICFTGVIKRNNIFNFSKHTANAFSQVYKIITNTYPQFSSP